MEYFAYGSNMLPGWLYTRVPSARVIGTASLSEHALRWHKRSTDDSGKCDAFRTGESGDEVHGVLYEIPREEKPALDRAEGVGGGYAERQVTVLCGATPKTVLTYLAQPTAINADLAPYGWYKALVVAGAREHRLPGPYVSRIEAQPSKPDGDAARRERALAVLGESGA